MVRDRSGGMFDALIVDEGSEACRVAAVPASSKLGRLLNLSRLPPQRPAFVNLHDLLNLAYSVHRYGT
jgi:hypothetical protein